MNKKDEFERLKPEAFEYQHRYDDDITPGFFFGVLLTVLSATALLVLFVLLLVIFII